MTSTAFDALTSGWDFVIFRGNMQKGIRLYVCDISDHCFQTTAQTAAKPDEPTSWSTVFARKMVYGQEFARIYLVL